MFEAHGAALLTRLTHEAALERAWDHIAPGAPPLPPRASGLVAALGHDPAQGPEPLVARLLSEDLEGVCASALHQLALLHARRAHASADGRAEGVGSSLRLCIASWLRLGAQERYLRDIARAALGPDASDAQLDAACQRAALRGIAHAAAIADANLDSLAPAGAAAMRALQGIDDPIAAAALRSDAGDRARQHAARMRAQSVRTLIAALERTLENLEARERSPAEVRRFFARCADAWRFSGQDREFEHLVVRAAPTFAWPMYRAKRWPDLRHALEPIESMVDHLATRIGAEPAELAWASQCSQVIVFRAEVATTLDEQMRIAERAFEVCPSLRNARLVLADLLCARAERLLDARGFLGGDLDALTRDVTRAADLYPPLKRLPELRERLAKRGRVVP